MFFYGTLKRGHPNHDRFCAGAVRVEESVVRGRLYDMPFGFPAMTVPQEDILARGTGEPLRDAARQREAGETGKLAGIAPEEGSCVFGELFVFDDPQRRLPALDELEGFRPGGESLYRRVLVPARIVASNTMVPAWAYVVDSPYGAHLPGGRWPAG